VSVLIDTNLLLRRAEPGHAEHETAIESLVRLRLTGVALQVTPQNIAEFWSVATRPIANNGLGLSIAFALAEVDRIERLFVLLPDTPAIYETWKRLVVEYGVSDSKVFDARLVAAMQVHGVDRILTFNISDFMRYGIDVMHPSAVP